MKLLTDFGTFVAITAGVTVVTFAAMFALWGTEPMYRCLTQMFGGN